MLAAQVQLLLDGLRSSPPDDFDVGEFVRHCRTLAPIQMLSDQMAQYGNQLQQQLVQLLNSDFEQYISLSVSLQGTETIIDQILKPISEVQQRLLTAFTSVNNHCTEIHSLLDQQSDQHHHRSTLLSSLPIAFSSSKPGSGGIERRARSAVFNKYIPFELKRDLQSRLLDLFSSAKLPDRFEIASTLRSFSFCELRHLAATCVKNTIASQLLALGISGDFPALFSSERTRFFAERCAFFDTVSSCRYFFLLDSFFAGLVAAIAPEPNPKSLFSATNLTQFHRNYTAYMSFVKFLNELRPGISQEPSVLAITNQFSLDVYFRLRFQVVIVKLENGFVDALAQRSSPPVAPLPPVSLIISETVANLAYACFSDDVFIDQVSAGFFSLSIQILSRYAFFVSEVIKSPSDSGFCLMLADDIAILVNWIENGLKAHCISHMLQERVASPPVLNLIDESISSVVTKLLLYQDQLKNAAVNSVVEACEIALEAVPRIKATYRMSGQNQPISALPYVQHLAGPLIKATSKINSVKEKSALGRHSIRAVSVSYRTACANLLDVMTQTESSLRRLGNTAGSILLADSSQRIAQQLRLDVEEFRRLLKEAAGAAEWNIDEAVDEILQGINVVDTNE